MSDSEAKYPELLADLRDDVEELLRESGLEEGRAAQVALAVAERVRERWSGMSFYIPKGRAWQLSRRDLQIYKRYTGDNVKQLCREFCLTEQRVYQVIAQVRAALIAKKQHRIPGF